MTTKRSKGKFSKTDILRILRNAPKQEVDQALAEINRSPTDTTLEDLKRLLVLASNLLVREKGLTPDSWFFPIAVGFIGDFIEKILFLLEAFFTTPSKGAINVGTAIADLTFPEIVPPESKFMPTSEYDRVVQELSDATKLVSNLQKEIEALKKSSNSVEELRILKSAISQLESWTERRKNLYEKRARELPIGDSQKIAAAYFNAHREFLRRVRQL